jgi:hypothetical protein
MINVFLQRSFKLRGEDWNLYARSKNKFLTEKQIEGQRRILEDRLEALGLSFKMGGRKLAF